MSESAAQRLATVATGLTEALALDQVAINIRRVSLLRQAIVRARERSPYWHERLSEVDLDKPELTLRNVPVLTRADVVHSVGALSGNSAFTTERLAAGAQLPSETMDGEFYVIATGGSTGEPVRIPVTLTEAAADATLASRRLRPLLSHLGIDPANARRVSVSAPKDGPHASALWRRLFPSPGEQLSIAQPLEEIVPALQRIKPDVFSTYPSILPALLQRARTGELSIEPKVVALGAENIDPAVAREVNDVWGSTIFNMWGASEVGMLASSDGLLPGMRLNDDCAIIELLGADNTEVQPGERFERVVVTPLLRTTVPLFRYEIADVGTLLDNAGPFRRISDIDGRSRSFLTWPTGTIHPAAFGALLATNPAIEKYQIQQTADGIEVTLVGRTDAPLDTSAIVSVLGRMLEPVIPNPVVRVHITADVPRSGAASKHHSVLPLERL